jgi:hypothetical protein
MLNIQPLVIKLSLHSSSSSECVEGKAYNENIQFVQTIIHGINRTKTYVIKILNRRRRWRANMQTRP